jgi:hypothetical protein
MAETGNKNVFINIFHIFGLQNCSWLLSSSLFFKIRGITHKEVYELKKESDYFTFVCIWASITHTQQRRLAELQKGPGALPLHIHIHPYFIFYHGLLDILYLMEPFCVWHCLLNIVSVRPKCIATCTAGELFSSLSIHLSIVDLITICFPTVMDGL